MSSAKKMVFFAVALGLLGGLCLYFWVQGRPGTPAINPLKKIDLTKVNRLVMQSINNTVTLDKQEKNWKMTTPVKDIVDPGIPSRILDALGQFTLGSIVSENPAKYSQFLLGPDQAAHLQVYLEGEKTPVLDAYLGKNVGSYANCYFRFEASTPVYIASNLPPYQFQMDPNAMRLMKIFPDSSNEALSVTIFQEKSAVELVRSSHTWSRKATGKAVDSALVQPLLAKLDQWNISEFATGQEPTDMLGFGKPYLRVALENQGGSANFSIGKKVPAKTPEMRYAQLEGREAVLLIREDSVADLLSSLKKIP